VARPLEAVRAAARGLGCVVLLKGSTTLVAQPDGRVLASCSAGPELAVAGSGDTLAGVLGALVATHAAAGGSPGSGTLATLAATAAVLHGLAGRHAAHAGMPGADGLAPALAEVLARH
jgi:NAD(P)H-hydrate repair Nnr-like enzyme with NAD(P)H-hydrate dehydratase domain